MQDGSLTAKGIGSTVQMSEPIGKVGTTGSSTGNHLHIEIKTSNSDGPGYLSSQTCTSSGFTDPLAFIAARLYSGATANYWQFSTNGQKEGWTTLPYEQAWSVGSDWLIESIGSNTRIYSPYMNRVPNSKIYVKLHMANQSACAVAQFYLQTVNDPFNSTMVKHFTAPANGAWGTVVIAVKDVPEYNVHGNWRRFRIQLPGTSCATGNWYFDYIHYVTDNVSPVVQSLAVSPSGWSGTNSFTATWGGWDGPDDGSGYGSGIVSYEVSVNGGAFVNVGSATSYAFTGAQCTNTFTVRATDKVGNVGPESTVPFYLDTTPPQPITVSVTPTSCTNNSSFNLDLGPWTDNCCFSHNDYRLGSGPWQSVNLSYFQIQAYQLGQNVVEAAAVDCAGNRGPARAAYFYFDDSPPAACVPSASPASCSSSNAFTFSWPAPAEAGCGLAGYEYQVESQPTVWTTGNTAQGALAVHEGANTFRVRARDVAGNWGAWGSTAFCWDGTGPASTVLVANPVVTTSSVGVTWRSTDALSPVTAFDVEFRDSTDATWDSWFTGTSDTSAVFGPTQPIAPTPGHAYFFRARATDGAGNVGAYSAGDAVVRFAYPAPLSWTDVTPPELQARSDWRGVAWGDFDGDGAPDLCAGLRGGGAKLFHNTGAGSFELVPQEDLASLVDVRSCAWADFDKDGDLDLVVVASNGCCVLRNDRETGWARMQGLVFDILSATGAAWGDYDRDGWVDLFVATENAGNHLIRNLGHGQFAEVSSPVVAAPSNARGVTWGDYDRDGRPDLFVANWNQPSRLFHNLGNGQFESVYPNVVGEGGPGTGGSWGDADGDGDLDLFATRNGAPSRLFRNDGAGGLVNATPDSLAAPFGLNGCAWADADGDGWLDLYASSDGLDRFWLAKPVWGFEGFPAPVPGASAIGLGVAWADIDGDLDPDLAVAHPGQALQILRNDDVSPRHWLKVRLHGLMSNTAGIGARISVLAGGMRQLREVSGGSGYYSQNELPAIFGLGNATVADSVIVEWPRGVRQVMADVAAGQVVDVVEETPDGASLGSGDGRLALAAPRPNPTDGVTLVPFTLPMRAVVSLRVYDVGGRLVRTLLEGREFGPGLQSVRWDGRGALGERLAAGVYHCRLIVGGRALTRRVVLLDAVR